jgi:hypothetical protein
MFFTLMVGTPRSLAVPPMGAAIDIFALMVDAPESPPLPPRGPAVDVSKAPRCFLSVHGGRSRISNSDTSQGARRR